MRHEVEVFVVQLQLSSTQLASASRSAAKPMATSVTSSAHNRLSERMVRNRVSSSECGSPGVGTYSALERLGASGRGGVR